jgi:UDP-N-acetylglucosamine--N-acetylmuramyl-(pentapeptide) pyrophosphoryl-undecaprenol N-acetylglucosamine transferase
MKVLMTGGGTAGHVIPLLAVASELRKDEPSAEIKYIGNRGDSFVDLVTDSKYFDHVSLIYAGKFRRYHKINKLVYLKDPRIFFKNLRDFFLFLTGIVQSLMILIIWRPDVIFVKGGFVGLPVGLAGAFLRIPIVTHDSDAVPGLTNRILSRYSTFQAVSMPTDLYSYKKDSIRLTGLPVRSEFAEVSQEAIQSARKKLGIDTGAFVVSVIGGSLGAKKLNDAVSEIAEKYLSDNLKNLIIHVTGKSHSESIENNYDKLPVNIRKRIIVFPYSNELHSITAASDIVITRAGSSIHELSVQKKCIILVPNPILTGGHQTKNAMLIERNNAALVIEEKELLSTNGEVLLDKIKQLQSDEDYRNKLANNLSKLAVPDAARNIVGVLKEAVRSKNAQ